MFLFLFGEWRALNDDHVQQQQIEIIAIILI
jgi:hypothetical protein